MKNNGALRKVMLIVLLSILGSYCIGSDENKSMTMFDSAMLYTYSFVTSLGNTCSKLWSEVVARAGAMLGSNHKKIDTVQKDNTVVIQKTSSQEDGSHKKTLDVQKELSEDEHMLEHDAMHGNNYACTDGRADCVYNEDFFNDSWFTGKLDEDWTTHLDVDTRPMLLVDSYDEQ